MNSHYELPIPWKDPEKDIPNNIVLAQKRLNNLVKCLQRKNLYTRYDDEISKLLAEVVPEDAVHNAKCIWYLLHHCVHNPNKPNKLRVVFDYTAQYAGCSLNECCLQGPDLVNKL